MKAPKTLGNQVGRYAIHLDVPVTLISGATGATRQTVYNWFSGGEVLQPYRAAVSSLLQILQSSPTREEARRRICSTFNLAS
jgi:hypothetical protein